MNDWIEWFISVTVLVSVLLFISWRRMKSGK
jgi:hypothetical protein